jgi:hypothetical protein
VADREQCQPRARQPARRGGAGEQRDGFLGVGARRPGVVDQRVQLQQGT